MTTAFPTADDMRMTRDGLAFRALAPDDAARVAALAGDIRVAGPTALIPSPYPQAEARAWIDSHEAQRRAGEAFYFAIASDDAPDILGCVSLDEMQDLGPSGRQYDLGYWVRHDAWGRGIASRAARAARDWAFEVLKTGRLTASCVADNAASRRVLEKTGFVYLNTCLKLRPARGTSTMVESYRLDKPRWERLAGGAA